MKLTWVEIVAKNSKLPDPSENIEIKQIQTTIHKNNTPKRYGTTKTCKKKHTCRWCNDDFEYNEIEKHLNDTHRSEQNFTYIVCNKCSFYLKVLPDDTKEDVLKRHNAEKHFFRNATNKYYLKLDKKGVMSAKIFLREVKNLQK
jgi:hypothetical protein